MVRKVAPFVFIFIVSVLSVLSLFHAGFPPTHDGEYHVIRFYEFYKTLMSGVLYPRWAPDLNYGFGLPLFTFVYPLPNYVAAFFHALGFQFVDAFKYNLILATFVGAYLMYFFAKDLFDSLSALVATVFFLFCPYRLVDVFVRGSVGEVWSIAIVPGILWMMLRLIKTGKPVYLLSGSVLFSLLIFSHNILALLFTPFLLTFGLFFSVQERKKREKLLLAGLVIFFGIGLSSIFWVPALFEKQYVKGLEVYDFTSQFPDVVSLLIPSWGTGFAGASGGNAMSTQIGLANLLVVMLSILFLIKTRRNPKSSLIMYCLLWFFLVILLMLPNSLFLWKALPLFNFVQFPWRYLSVVVIICAVLSAGVIYMARRKYILAVVLVVFMMGTTVVYARFSYYHKRDDSYYISRSNFIDGSNSPGNAFNTVYLNTKLKRTATTAEFTLGGGSIIPVTISAQKQIFALDVASPSSLLLHTLYFPGWEAEDNKGFLPLARDDGGRMKIFLIPGKYFITVRLTDTIVQRLSAILSAVSFLLLCVATVIVAKGNESRN